jgi:nitronate monooxygenase
VNFQTRFTRDAVVRYPILCGAMFPCSNPELVAAVSEAGGLGIVQPLSMTYVHGFDYRDGLRFIRTRTDKPIALNATIEKSSRVYEERLRRWIDIGIEEGIRFFDTSLGNPKWVVDRVSSVGGIVYHKVTERKWALKARDAGVHGLIAINDRAGGHAGQWSAEKLLEELSDLNLPLICGGGVGDESEFRRLMSLGYDGVMMATRFIATFECTAHDSYKRAIVEAKESDIVHTMRVTGVPLAVIRTPGVDKVGTKAGPIARFMLQRRRLKKYMRIYYALRSFRQLKRSSLKGAMSSRDYYQAGKSVAGIDRIEAVADIIQRFVSFVTDDTVQR